MLRPPPDVSLYHRKSNTLFPAVLAALGTRDGVHAVVVPRTQPAHVRRELHFPSLIVPGGAVDGQSLIALADLVVSAGGTMNREAVALGTPVYTIYGGRLGGVDERLIRERPAASAHRSARASSSASHRGAGNGNAATRGLLVDVILGSGVSELPAPAGPAAEPRGAAAPPASRRSGRSPSATPASPHASSRGRVDCVLRLLDIVFARWPGRALGPLMARAAAAVRATGRPVLYRGARVGRGGYVFAMYKFRTLRAGRRGAPRPHLGDELDRADRARATRGRPGPAADAARRAAAALQRRCAGDMAIVGPRPIRPRVLRGAGRRDPRRTGSGSSSGPGLTGLAQLRMTREMTWAEKLAHDLEFIADRSVRLYLAVIAATAARRVAAVAGGRTRRAECAASAGLLAARRGARRERDALEAMSAALVHRGPDGSGIYLEGPRGLAARRLSIIDLDGGHQPVSTADGAVTVVQNGEIYNHARPARELRRARRTVREPRATPR